MTSNLGGRDINEKMCEQYGFVGSTHESKSKLNHKIEQAGICAARKTFSPEFMNRIDRVVTFRPLDCDQLADVLSIELGFVQRRLNHALKGAFSFHATVPARQFLLREGTDQRYGARQLKRAIERHLVSPLASLISTCQLEANESVSINWDGSASHLDFYKQPGPLTFQSVTTRQAAVADGTGTRQFVRAA